MADGVTGVNASGSIPYDPGKPPGSRPSVFQPLEPAEPPDTPIRQTAEKAAKAVQDRDGLPVEPERSETDQREIEELKARDREVRQHERSHVAAGGAYVRGTANYTYTTGPDGRRYATGGDVKIDLSEEQTPEATLRKMQTVKRAAVAVSEPSPQDRQVYAEAARLEREARQELAEQRREERAPADSGEEAPAAIPGPEQGPEPFDLMA